MIIQCNEARILQACPGESEEKALAASECVVAKADVRHPSLLGRIRKIMFIFNDASLDDFDGKSAATATNYIVLIYNYPTRFLVVVETAIILSSNLEPINTRLLVFFINKPPLKKG